MEAPPETGGTSPRGAPGERVMASWCQSGRPLSYLPDDLRYDAAIVRGSFGIRIPLDLRLFTPPIPKLAFHFR